MREQKREACMHARRQLVCVCPLSPRPFSRHIIPVTHPRRQSMLLLLLGAGAAVTEYLSTLYSTSKEARGEAEAQNAHTDGKVSMLRSVTVGGAHELAHADTHWTTARRKHPIDGPEPALPRKDCGSVEEKPPPPMPLLLSSSPTSSRPSSPFDGSASLLLSSPDTDRVRTDSAYASTNSTMVAIDSMDSAASSSGEAGPSGPGKLSAASQLPCVLISCSPGLEAVTAREAWAALGYILDCSEDDVLVVPWGLERGFVAITVLGCACRQDGSRDRDPEACAKLAAPPSAASSSAPSGSPAPTHQHPKIPSSPLPPKLGADFPAEAPECKPVSADELHTSIANAALGLRSAKDVHIFQSFLPFSSQGESLQAPALDESVVPGTVQWIRHALDMHECPARALKLVSSFSVTCSRISKNPSRNVSSSSAAKAIGGALAARYSIKGVAQCGEAHIHGMLLRKGLLLTVLHNTSPLNKHSVSSHGNIAFTLLQLAQVEAGQRILDPFCGRGALLIEAFQVFKGSVQADGCDYSRRYIEAAQSSIQPLLEGGRASASTQPPLSARVASPHDFHDMFGDDAFDAIVTNAPWGVKSGLIEDLEQFYRLLLLACHRVLKPGRLFVVVVLRSMLFLETVRSTGLWEVRDANVTKIQGSLPTVFVLEKRPQDDLSESILEQLHDLEELVAPPQQPMLANACVTRWDEKGIQQFDLPPLPSLERTDSLSTPSSPRDH